ncbi:hypothetical protein M8C21_014874, partial [Ambrosia artemisiifolia]
KNFLNWYGPQAELVITDTKIIREIASNRSVAYARPDLGPYHKKMLGDGLVTSSGKKWASQRKVANRAFSGESLKNMIPMMVASAGLMLDRWKKMAEGEVEMYAEFKMLTAEVISRTAFGSSYLQGKEVFKMLNEMGTIAGRNYYNPRLKTNDDLKSDEFEKRVHDLIMETINERENIMGHHEDAVNDFLGQLMMAKNNNTNQGYQHLTQDIIDECKTFYAAGDGTTSLLLSWVVLLLSIHTEWQERARDEVFQIFGKESQPRFEGLAKLKTIGMIINETLRLYPPGTAIIRKNEREVTLGNLIVPANVILHVPVLALHHDRDIWGEDAHLFKPERFSQGISNAMKNNPSAYMPFGFGPRNCVGSDFATNTAKQIAAMKDQVNTTPFTDISHDIYPRIQPHFFTWFRLYGDFVFKNCSKIGKNSDDHKSDELQKKIHDLIMETINEREKIMGHEDADNTDFLGQLLMAKNNNNNQGYQLSTQDIIDECKTFYVSGDGTTSLLLSWAVLLLSIHTEWQERARDEVFQIFGKDSQLRSEGLAKLKTIGMIINETLRLYPPGIAIIRKNEQEVKLGNLTVPANIILHVPVLALHHDREIWGEDAHLFKPERFSQGVSNAMKNNPSAYMPFGFGPRNCVGSNFATNTAKVTLAMMLQRYRFSPSPNYVHEPVHILMLVPKNGVQVTLHALK